MEEQETYRAWVKEILTEIKEQTTKTNGRVLRLEDRQDKADINWAYMKGAMAVVTALLVPILLMVVSQMIK